MIEEHERREKMSINNNNMITLIIKLELTQLTQTVPVQVLEKK
jgi:hypothetical protein